VVEMTNKIPRDQYYFGLTKVADALAWQMFLAKIKTQDLKMGITSTLPS
jgi:hypothetical protein